MKFPNSNYESIKPEAALAEVASVVETDDGTRVRVVRKALQDPEPYKDFTSHDFELQTLIETGNINNIQSVHSLPGDALEAIDAVTDTYNRIVTE